MTSIKDYAKLIRLDHSFGVLSLYGLGVALAFKLLNAVNFNALLGALSLFFAYASVYVFNDIMDVEEDKKHYSKFKRNRPLPSGRISVKTAKKVFLANAVLGYITASLVNLTFLAATLIITQINYIYSAFKIKRHFLASMCILGLVQGLKIMLGWISIQESLFKMPITLVLSICFAYLFIMGIYKKERYKHVRHYKAFQTTTGLLAIFAFFTSFTCQDLRNSLAFFTITCTIIGIFTFLQVRKKDIDQKFVPSLIIMPALINFLSLSIIFL